MPLVISNICLVIPSPPPPILKQPCLLPTPPFLWKKSEPPPFFKNSENSTRGRGVGGTIML